MLIRLKLHYQLPPSLRRAFIASCTSYCALLSLLRRASLFSIANYSDCRCFACSLLSVGRLSFPLLANHSGYSLPPLYRTSLYRKPRCNGCALEISALHQSPPRYSGPPQKHRTGRPPERLIPDPILIMINVAYGLVASTIRRVRSGV